MENKIKFKIMTNNLIKKIKIQSNLLIQKIIIINNQKLKIFISVFQPYVRLL